MQCKVSSLKKFSFYSIFTLIFSIALLSVRCNGEKKPQESEPQIEHETAEPDSVREAYSGNTYQKQYVKKGDIVTCYYVGTLRDGTVFHKATPEMPFIFKVGTGEVLKGFDDAVIGMKLNEKKRIMLPPEMAHGRRNEYLVKRIPIEEIPPDQEIVKGKTIEMYDQYGKKIPATVIDVTDKAVTFDLNHPLAGKTLIYDIQVIDIK